MLQRAPHRQRRAVAMIAVVLMTVLAAAVVLVIATQSIQASRTASNQSDATTATQAAADTQRSLETWIEQDPYAFLSTVSPYEDARVCTDGSIVQPGANFSTSECGTSWTYQTPNNLTDHATQNSSSTLNSVDSAIVEVQLQAPSAASPFLHATITSLYGNYRAGLQLTYRMTGSEVDTIFSSSDLHLDNLASGCSGTCSTLTGSVYTDGTLYLPTGSSVATTANTQLESETGFSPTPAASSSSSYYSPIPSPGTGSAAPIYNLRSVVPTQLTLSALRAAAARNTEIACPASNPSSYFSDGALTSLCLTPGTTIPALYSPAASGPGSITVPSSVTGYLLVFSDSGQSPSRPDTVSVYYASTPISPAGNCTASCDLLSSGEAGGDVANGVSPGEYSFWQSNLLGVFTIPRSGLIYTSADTYLSLCANAGHNAPWATYGSSCPAISSTSGSAGMTVGQSATVIAGTAANPANIYISGSINAAPGVSFGAVAAGAVVLPYWARPPGTGADQTLTIQGAYTALGYGVSTGSAVQTFPTSVDTTIADNVAHALNLTGSLAAASINLNLNMFSQVSLQGSPQLASAPPPYFTDFNGSWDLISHTSLPMSVLTN